ncbi:phospholipase D family protein [Psychromonas sp. RZ22]|uniref:phospholipase D family protein n=1 Tax=Psychromonas algarum TaxID=2555643 RepID=UPI0010678BB0|nr:phospholipase D family protein [Psychromonas sp. RZ22]TEW53264.1 phospholipase D family protein [Psychromonas sp. RZ22]
MITLQRTCITILLMTIITGCASLPETVEHTTSPLAKPTTSKLSEIVNHSRPQQSKSSESAFILQQSGWDALSQRIALIESANHNIDIQYYIWNEDTSGNYLASRLIAAAKRGVHVRILLDDFNLSNRDALLATIDNHPNIEIRVYNPIPSRNGVMKLVNVTTNFSRLNRRMHNKSFTVDGVLSVVGGRNIGDEYFDLSNEVNFNDRDVLVAGKVVDEIQDSFLQYWDGPWSYPISLISNKTSTNLTTLETAPIPHYQHYPNLPEGKESSNTLLTNVINKLIWGKAHYTSDSPITADVRESDKPKATARLLAKLAQQSKQQILIESAYLIFDDRQLKALQKLTDKGIQIKILTNSMASNDLITNHSGYAGRRTDMLEHGIQLFELKPETKLCIESTRDQSKCMPIAHYGLHAKSAVYDRKIATIGSFNYNLRSTYLNTEAVLVIENQHIAEALATSIEQAMQEENSWRLALHDEKPRWYSGDKTWDSEPETGKWQRFNSYLLQLLPIEKYL